MYFLRRDQQVSSSLLAGRLSCNDRLLSTQLGTSENKNKGEGVIQPAVSPLNPWKLSHSALQSKKASKCGEMQEIFRKIALKMQSEEIS